VAEQLATGYLASEAERLRSHAIEVSTEVRTGSPAAELIAAVQPSDLVVMTAFGGGTGRRWLLGGVAGKLIRSAHAPVLVVRPVGAAARAA
jgi:nucleotide-binding universal stress UspA family protein